MTIQFESLLSNFRLMHCVITFVKYEGDNLTTMAFALHSIINCEPLKLIKVNKSTFLNDMMFKACQYAPNDYKVF
jgi:hypothetical protein